ncbi:MAG: hypothetical protein HY876_10380 [Coriobacteriales bacterium]|nr:hypothetical protein [Coriobacteriales bacterium]
MEIASVRTAASSWVPPTGLAARPLIASAFRGFPDALARGLALFFGIFSLANSLSWLTSRVSHADIWWIDLSFLPRWLASGFGVAVAVLLLTYGIAPRPSRARGLATSVACVLLGIATIVNGVAFYLVWRTGAIAPGMPFPLSFLFAAGFSWLALRAL